MKKLVFLFIVLIGYFATAQNPAKFRSGIDVTGQADITGTIILQPQAAPGSPVTGEVYYDSTQNQIFQWNGTSWTTLGGIDIQALTQTDYNALSAQDKLEFVGYIVEPGTGQGDASDIDVVTTSFGLNLSGADTNVQLALNTLDDVVIRNLIPYTPAEYAALTQPQKDTLNAVIVDDTAILGDFTDDQTAAEVTYDNTISGLTATNAKTAIDEIVDEGIVVHPTSPNDLSSIYIGTVEQIGGAGLGIDVLAIPIDATNLLSDLDDVNTATITSGNILVADGVDFESVSMSGDATMTNAGVVTVTDISPSAEIDLGANSIGQTAQSLTGTDGTTTIDWGNGNVFNFQYGAFNETFTFTAPTKPGTFILKLVQDSVGSRTATWPATVKWPGGTAPTLTNTATTGTDIITFYYDGTNYFAVSSLNFS